MRAQINFQSKVESQDSTVMMEDTRGPRNAVTNSKRSRPETGHGDHIFCT